MSKRPKAVHQMTIAEFEAMFPDEDACCAYLVARRWPEGVRCPRCGAENPHKLSNRSWQCYQCAPETSYRFSHIAGTIFENTNKPLRDWFRIVHMMMTGKKGISALQVKRVMGFGSYESAWSMCHKIRTALIENPVEQLGRIVEMDETYASGEDKNRHWDKRSHRRGRGAGGKTPVIGAVKRKGNVVARVVNSVSRHVIEQFVREAVSNRVSLLCTDSFSAYDNLKTHYPHGVVDHSAGQHVVGAIHTNTIEGFWSLLKRGIMGSFHKVSPKYMPLYVAEFAFRCNNRDNADIFGAAVSRC
jgi:transposase-like protein